jgi:Protein of unknown function (DUF3467)
LAQDFPPGNKPESSNRVTDFVIWTNAENTCFAVQPASAFSFSAQTHLHFQPMSLPNQPNVKLVNSSDYRESYANSVQMRVNIWDFFLAFGTLQQQSETQVEIKNFQGIYLSPQQAKALLGLLQQNVAGYESAFGEIKLDPRMGPTGPVH